MNNPKPVKSEMRICFGIEWYKSEADAMLAHARVRAEYRKYNGGWYHGAPCGRETRFDYEDKEIGKLYAVTC